MTGHGALNAHQARSVAVALRHAERALAAAVSLPQSEGILHGVEDDLSPEERARLVELAAAARAVIARLADRFDLERDVVPLRQMLRAHLSTAWASLEDIRPGRLGRYGPVDPALQETLGPDLEALIALVLAMEAIVNRRVAGVSGCPFCAASRLAPGLLEETAAFRVVADRAPLTPSHILLIPKAHLPCFGALPADLDAEYTALRARMAAFLATQPGEPLYFEHGGVGQTVPHAHLHALAVPRRLGLREDLAFLGRPVPVPDTETLRRLYRTAGPYVYVEEGGHPLAVPVDRLEPGDLQRRVRERLGETPAPTGGSASLQRAWLETHAET